jgi:hypothetical protein
MIVWEVHSLMGMLYSYTHMSLDGVVEAPEKWDDSVPFATLNNSIRKYVISSSLSERHGRQFFEDGHQRGLALVNLERLPHGVRSLTCAPT